MRSFRLVILGKFNWAFAVFLLFVATAIASPAQMFTTLHSFDKLTTSYAGLVQAANGDFYGTTYNADGTVFKISPSGKMKKLFRFDNKDGRRLLAGLVQGTDGYFYGTSSSGGANHYGTIFKITAGGALTTLHNFDGTDGAYPYAGLIQAADRAFYGTTVNGGANGNGTVLKITEGGTLTTLHSFDVADGANPVAGLVQAVNGDFYGTTASGGTSGDGTIFRITPSGKLTTLYSFCSQSGCADGASPEAGLVQSINGDFYGTTASGGVSDDGTVFKITQRGTLTTLHSFDGTDGSVPYSGLVQATDGDLYGTTTGEPSTHAGTIYKITPDGTLMTLYRFCSQSGCPDGAGPFAGLVQATDGNFYGITLFGGANNSGTIFSLSAGLGPFVETQTASARVGVEVKILGNNLIGASGVMFNGTAAVFTVVSSSLIKTNVPSGASSGFVTVTTPSGTLTSNVEFRVRP